MIKLNRHETQPAVIKNLFMALAGAAILLVAGCSSERDANDGREFNTVVLPTDAVLSLYCANVGLAAETCVLDDPENPFSSTVIIEFNVNDPESANKFQLADTIPAGPTGAKARFYFWATALARRQSGENQYYTALALHELFTANSIGADEDELIKEHALRAYRSVLDNFFGGVVAFKCFECRPDLPKDSPDIPQQLIPLNERVADHLYRQASTATDVYPFGLRRLPPGTTTIEVLDMFVDWGYSYQPCTDLPNCTDGVVGVGEF